MPLSRRPIRIAWIRRAGPVLGLTLAFAAVRLFAAGGAGGTDKAGDGGGVGGVGAGVTGSVGSSSGGLVAVASGGGGGSTGGGAGGAGAAGASAGAPGAGGAGGTGSLLIGGILTGVSGSAGGKAELLGAAGIGGGGGGGGYEAFRGVSLSAGNALVGGSGGAGGGDGGGNGNGNGGGGGGEGGAGAVVGGGGQISLSITGGIGGAGGGDALGGTGINVFAGNGGDGGDGVSLTAGTGVGVTTTVRIAGGGGGVGGSSDAVAGIHASVAGSGGSGGAAVQAAVAGALAIDDAGQIVGGVGGAGGQGLNIASQSGADGANGGSGGVGGAGIAVSATAASLYDSGSGGGLVQGGSGGAGGAGAYDSASGAYGDGGAGGAGGVGIAAVGGLFNALTVTGGQGGNGGASALAGSGLVSGSGGAGGDGIDTGNAVTNTGQVSGGTGGSGAAGAQASGNGGAGGTGMYVQAGAFGVNNGTVSGGAGGQGGQGLTATSGAGGAGGQGGAGIVALAGSTLVNSGAVLGGVGGLGGAGSAASNGTNGWGGVGVSGCGVTLINSGSIAGGLSADGLTRSAAVVFTGGINTLMLEPGSTISGNVLAYSPADTLVLGGPGSASFNVAALGASGTAAQYQGFGQYLKTGRSVWTLSGADSQAGVWTIGAGTLNVSSDAALGSSGTLGLGGAGVLQWGAAFDSSRTITLTAGGGVFDPKGTSDALSGILSGPGGLTLADSAGAPGILTLTAANTYQGGTTVDSGTLAVSGAGTLGLPTGALTLNGGVLALDAGVDLEVGSLSGTGGTVTVASVFTVDEAGSSSYTGSIQGPGQLVKTGDGVLALDGVGTYAGGTLVQGGTLLAGDALHPNASIPGNVSVTGGGTLGGYGTVVGSVNVFSGGVVAPGDAALGAAGIGALGVGGNYTQASSGKLVIEVSPQSASTLEVGGRANLDGTLQVVYAPGVYAPTTYTLVSATGGVSGAFRSVAATQTTGWTTLDGTLKYSANDVALSVASTQWVEPADTSIFGALGDVALLGSEGLNEALMDRMGDLAYGMDFDGGELLEVPGTEADPKSGAWIRNTGTELQVKGGGQAAGYSAISGGVLAGWDRRWDKIQGGIAFGDSHTNVSVSDGESGSIDGPSVALYGGMQRGEVRVDADLGLVFQSFSSTRTIPGLGQNAAASYGGQSIVFAAEAARTYSYWGWTLVPMAGLQVVSASEKDAAESGAGSFDLAVTGQGGMSVKQVAEVSAGKSMKYRGWSLCPDLSLGCSTQTQGPADGRSVSANGATFSAPGAGLPGNEFSVGAGVAAELHSSLALAADFKAIAPMGSLTEESASVSVRYQFMLRPGRDAGAIQGAKTDSSSAEASQPGGDGK